MVMEGDTRAQTESYKDFPVQITGGIRRQMKKIIRKKIDTDMNKGKGMKGKDLTRMEETHRQDLGIYLNLYFNNDQHFINDILILQIR